MFEEFRIKDSEKLKIYRARNDLNQRELAIALGLSRTMLQQIEKDKRNLEELPEIIPTKEEICFLLRLRNNLTQTQVANQIGIPRLSVIDMEKGRASPEKLITFWRNYRK